MDIFIDDCSSDDAGFICSSVAGQLLWTAVVAVVTEVVTSAAFSTGGGGGASLVSCVSAASVVAVVLDVTATKGTVSSAAESVQSDF